MVAFAVLPNELSINHARLIGSAGRRAELEAGLRRLNLGDVLPPGEILVIPKMRAATPLAPGMPPSLFASRLADQLRRTRSEALLDPTGTVPSGEAFRFSSLVSYAAWLMITWLRPQSVQAKAVLAELLRGESVEHYQRRAILHDGRIIVRLVAILARAGAAAQWAERLTPEDVQTAIRAIGKSFGFEPGYSVGDTGDERGGAAHRAMDAASPIASEESPLLRLSSLPRLPTARRPKIRQNVTLRPIVHRAATKAGPDLARASHDRQALVLTAIILTHRPNAGRLLDGPGWLALPPLADGSIAMDTPRPARLPQLPTHVDRPSLPAQSQQKVEKTQQSVLLAADESVAPTVSDCPASPRSVADAPCTKAGLADAAVANPLKRSRQSEFAGIAPFARHFETQFGGLMFVTNILIALKLYPDFTEPHGQRLEPSPFWLLAQLGLRFFRRAFRRDPLFALLCACGHSGRLPEKWVVAPEWYSGLPQGRSSRTSFDGKYLTRWDVRGFVAFVGPERSWSRKALAAHARPGRGGRKLPARTPDRWIACLGDFILFRMKMAAPGLCLSGLRMPARVTLSDGGVDLHFVLAQLPMAVRLAGLDRDPGWLPAEGRNLSFHFS